MIPVEDAEPYCPMRQREALAMAETTADPPVRKRHFEMARLYAELVGDGHDASIAVLGSTVGPMPSNGS